MNAAFDTIGRYRIVPVVVIEDAERIVPLCTALRDGDLPIAEITLRTEAALEAIRTATRECPEVMIGAGTVLTADQAEAALDAGARFIVGPGFHPEVVKFCVERGVPVIPGCATPTEIGYAHALGLDVVKFFPAEACGGVEALKAMSAPFGSMRFVPTGGIDASNVARYLALPNVLACGGSWMVKASLIAGGEFEEVERLARQAAGLVASVRPPPVV